MHFRRCAVVVTIEATTFRGGVMAIEVFWGSGSPVAWRVLLDRKSTRLNSSHSQISYAVFCLKKKKKTVNSNDRNASVHILTDLHKDTYMMTMTHTEYHKDHAKSGHDDRKYRSITPATAHLKV